MVCVPGQGELKEAAVVRKTNHKGLENVFFPLCPLCGLQMQLSLVEEMHVWGNTGTCSAIVMFDFTFMGFFFPETGIPDS